MDILSSDISLMLRLMFIVLLLASTNLTMCYYLIYYIFISSSFLCYSSVILLTLIYYLILSVNLTSYYISSFLFMNLSCILLISSPVNILFLIRPPPTLPFDILDYMTAYLSLMIESLSSSVL